MVLVRPRRAKGRLPTVLPTVRLPRLSHPSREPPEPPDLHKNPILQQCAAQLLLRAHFILFCCALTLILLPFSQVGVELGRLARRPRLRQKGLQGGRGDEHLCRARGYALQHLRCHRLGLDLSPRRAARQGAKGAKRARPRMLARRSAARRAAAAAAAKDKMKESAAGSKPADGKGKGEGGGDSSVPPTPGADGDVGRSPARDRKRSVPDSKGAEPSKRATSRRRSRSMRTSIRRRRRRRRGRASGWPRSKERAARRQKPEAAAVMRTRTGRGMRISIRGRRPRCSRPSSSSRVVEEEEATGRSSPTSTQRARTA